MNSKRSRRWQAERLSVFIDEMNAGTAGDIDSFLQKHPEDKIALSEIKDAILVAKSVRGAELFDTLTDSQKSAGFERACSTMTFKLPSTTSCAPDILSIDKRSDLLILMLHFMGKVWGRLKLVKIPFLMAKEGQCNSFVADFYAHEAYNYGAFDKTILTDVDELCQGGFVEVKTPLPKKRKSGQDLGIPNAKKVDSVYALSPQGKQIAEALIKWAKANRPEILSSIQDVVKRHGQKTADELCAYTYNTYIDSAANSLVREKYMKPPLKNSGDTDE